MVVLSGRVLLSPGLCLLNPPHWDRFLPLCRSGTPCFCLLSLASLNNDSVPVSVSVALSWQGALEYREHVTFSLTLPISTSGMDKWPVVLGPFEILQNFKFCHLSLLCIRQVRKNWRQFHSSTEANLVLSAITHLPLTCTFSPPFLVRRV